MDENDHSSERLELRSPAWFWVSLAWVFAGPLSPVFLAVSWQEFVKGFQGLEGGWPFFEFRWTVTIAGRIMPIAENAKLIALPAAIGVLLTFLFLRRGAVTTARIFAMTFLAAALMIPFAGLLYFEPDITKPVQIIISLAAPVLFFPLSVIVAAPSALVAATLIRWLAYRNS